MKPLRNKIKYDAYVKCEVVKKKHNINLDNKDHLLVYSKLKILVGEMFSSTVVLTMSKIDAIG